MSQNNSLFPCPFFVHPGFQTLYFFEKLIILPKTIEFSIFKPEIHNGVSSLLHHGENLLKTWLPRTKPKSRSLPKQPKQALVAWKYSLTNYWKKTGTHIKTHREYNRTGFVVTRHSYSSLYQKNQYETRNDKLRPIIWRTEIKLWKFKTWFRGKDRQ